MVSPWESLRAFMETDPRDAGCDETRAHLHTYADLVAGSGDPEEHLPGITAHLRSCPPCDDELRGLLHALGVDTR